MESFIKDNEHLKIPLEEIKSATDNFDDTKVIGSGGFGRMYKGVLSHFKGRSMVAIKCLNRKFEKDDPGFMKEIMMRSHYTHKNLLSLLGFCNEGDEMILVYEYASNGSLDRHLSSTDFTWTQRLKICIDIARGIEYLHSNTSTEERIFHRDIKSANILLDQNWSAKISDLGLSKIAPTDQPHTGLFTKTVVTPVYLDPLYLETGIPTNKSDVYAFGVILFELLCGGLCSDYSNDQSQGINVPMLKKRYEQNRLQEVILNDLKVQISLNALESFSDIAYKCLQTSSEGRPTMLQVLEELETALEYQEFYDGVQLKTGYEQRLMITDLLNYRSERELMDYKKLLMITVKDPLNNIPESELKMLLHKGIIVNRGKTWFSLNVDEEHCEMIAIAECLTSASESQHYMRSPEYNSRFAGGCYEPFGASFKTHVQTQFLSPRITYTVNLVLKNRSKSRYIGLKYKLKGEPCNSYSFLSDEREDGWLTAELYQFTSDQRTVDLEIWFYTECCPTILVEGIEFRPLQKVEHEVITNDKVGMQLIPDRETYWEQKLPGDYEDIIKRSKDSVQWKTKKDLYSILCRGFLISYGEEWFYLAKDGKKCLTLPARAALEEDRWKWNPEPESRFEEVADCISDTFGIFCKFSSQMLSPQVTYATFLVYELPDEHESVDQPPPVQVVDKDSDAKEVHNIFLRTPQTPFISWNEKEGKTFSPSGRPKVKGLPKRRSDGWMEVQVHEVQTRAAIKMISTRLKLSSYDMSLKGIIVQGLDFRPV